MSFIATAPEDEFPIQNLPFGVFSTAANVCPLPLARQPQRVPARTSPEAGRVGGGEGACSPCAPLVACRPALGLRRPRVVHPPVDCRRPVHFCSRPRGAARGSASSWWISVS